MLIKILNSVMIMMVNKFNRYNDDGGGGYIDFHNEEYISGSLSKHYSVFSFYFFYSYKST